MYAHTKSNHLNSLDIFSWKLVGMLQTPIGSFWDLHLLQGITIVQSCLNPGDNSILWYPIFKSKYNAYIKPSNFRSIYFILGIGDIFLRILRFCFLKLYKILLFHSFWLNKIGGSPLRPIHIFKYL